MDNEVATPAPARAMQIVQGAVAARLLATLTEAGVPDVLADGPQSVGGIARRTGLEPDALGRALRAAATLGVVSPTGDGRWRNGEVGEALRSDAPGSVRDYVVYALHDGNWRAWQAMTATMRTGRPAFPEANEGLSFWAYLNAHEDVARAFHGGMAAATTVSLPALPPALGLERFRRIVDVGGGSGVTLAALLEAQPSLRGVLYDRPEAIAASRARFAERGLLERVSLEAGDLFERVPEGADAYLLKNILHDHDAAGCDRILEVLRAAMTPAARLFVVEAVLPEGAQPHPAIWRDIHMMVALGGRERTEAEWRALLRAHGLTVERITAMPGPDAVIEVRRAG